MGWGRTQLPGGAGAPSAGLLAPRRHLPARFSAPRRGRSRPRPRDHRPGARFSARAVHLTRPRNRPVPSLPDRAASPLLPTEPGKSRPRRGEGAPNERVLSSLSFSRPCPAGVGGPEASGGLLPLRNAPIPFFPGRSLGCLLQRNLVGCHRPLRPGGVRGMKEEGRVGPLSSMAQSLTLPPSSDSHPVSTHRNPPPPAPRARRGPANSSHSGVSRNSLTFHLPVSAPRGSPPGLSRVPSSQETCLPRSPSSSLLSSLDTNHEAAWLQGPRCYSQGCAPSLPTS